MYNLLKNRFNNKKIIYENIVDNSLIGGIRVLANEVSTIINSLVKLDELRNKVMFYKRRVKPSTVMVKKLSLQ